MREGPVWWCHGYECQHVEGVCFVGVTWGSESWDGLFWAGWKRDEIWFKVHVPLVLGMDCLFVCCEVKCTIGCG